MTFIQTVRVVLTGAALTLPVAGCASTGTRPGDMSAANHEAMAQGEQKNAVGHAGQYDPNATQAQQPRSCVGYEVAADCSEAWTVNPTEQHRSEAVSHRALAAKHRAASEALVGAEAQSCKNVPAADRDTSPFDHRDDIERVEKTQETKGYYGGQELGGFTKSGARVVFFSRPGMTAEWLQRVVDCHLARNAVMGYQMSEMAACPLNIKGAQAQVVSVGDGFAVDITSADKSVAKQIQARAAALTPTGHILGAR